MHAILIILTAAIVTLLIRALPFIVFSKHTPDSILYLGKVLPYAIIPMLVVYCLKSVSVLKAPLWYSRAHSTYSSSMYPQMET